MDRNYIFAAIVALAAFNGIFSPFLLVAVAWAPVWYPAWLADDVRFLFLFGSLIVATTLLIASGVPAALAERLAPKIAARNGDLWVWLAAMIILSLPAFGQLLG